MGAVWPRPQRAVSLMVWPSSMSFSMSPSSPCTVADAGDDLEHALGAYPAGRALAAALLLGELQEEAGHVDHAAVLVHDDEAAGAHDGAQFLHGFVVHGHVQVLPRDGAAGRTAQLGGLVLLVAGDAAGDVVDDVAQGDAHVDFHQAHVVDLAREGEDLGAGALLGAGGAEPVGALADDPGMVASVSTLLSTEGLPHRPFWAGNGGRGRGSPRLPSMEVMSAVSSPQTKAPEPWAMWMSKLEVGAQDVLAQQAVVVAGLRWRCPGAPGPADTRPGSRCSPRRRRWRAPRSSCPRARRAGRSPGCCGP